MDDLANALDDLTNRLRRRGKRSAEMVLKEVAGDWDLKPELLGRHFESLAGSTVDEYPKAQTLKLTHLVRQILKVDSMRTTDPQQLQAAYNRAVSLHENLRDPRRCNKLDLRLDKDFSLLVRDPDGGPTSKPVYLFVRGDDEVERGARLRCYKLNLIRISDGNPVSLYFDTQEARSKFRWMFVKYGSRELPTRWVMDGPLDWRG